VLVLLTHRTRLIGDRWLAPLLSALDGDPTVAGACSRVGPSDDADLLTVRDAERDPSGSPERVVKRIEDWAVYERSTPEERRLLANFHTVAAALRADIVRRIPFRTVRAIGEDLCWARDVLEAGLALVHEPASQVRHSHAYTLYERFTRNVDDGVANHDIVGRELSLDGVDELVRAMIADDWRFLREEAGLTGDELERWKVEAALRRVAQGCGQWLGVNHEWFSADVINAFSRVVAMRTGAVAVGEAV
jgi:hypothetical protein